MGAKIKNARTAAICFGVVAACTVTLSFLSAQSQPSKPNIPGGNPPQAPNNPARPNPNNPINPNIPTNPNNPNPNNPTNPNLPRMSPVPGVSPINVSPAASIAPLATPGGSPMASATPLIR